MRTLAREPTPLAAGAAKTGEAPLPFEFATAVMSSEQSRGLRRAATAQAATLNDLLIRDALLAVADWNAARGTRGNYLRMNVPASLRERADNDLSACNVLGFGFVSASVRSDSDPQRLLLQVRGQTERIKRERTGMQFLGGLGLACCIPGVVPWALSRRRSFATLVLSNVGKVLARVPLPRSQGKLVSGGATLDRITGVPPVRPLTRGALGVINYADETTLNLRIDPHALSRQDAYDFLRCYIDRLERSIGEQIVRVESRPAVKAAAIEEQ
jgi:hypothetical protein